MRGVNRVYVGCLECVAWGAGECGYLCSGWVVFVHELGEGVKQTIYGIASLLNVF